MLIAHLPAAYLAFKAFAPRRLPRAIFWAGVVGGIAPDLDMLWFYFVDNKQHHHHDYLTHRPALWLGLLALGVLLHQLRKSRVSAMGIALSLGAILHLVLDSIAGKIAWLWPLSDTALPLVVVQPTHSHWILSFMSHWTFQVEIVLVLAALIGVWRANRKPA